MSTVRRLFLSGAFALGLLVLAATAASAHEGHLHGGPLADSGSGGFVGTLVLDHGDNFAAGTSVEHWQLVAGGWRTRLDVTGEVRAEPGAKVRVHGRKVGQTIEVDVAAGAGTTEVAAIETIEAASPPPAVAKKVLVLLVNFTDNTSQPFTLASAQTVMSNVTAYYAEASYGSMSTTYDVYGWWQINDDQSNCDYSNWGSLARSKATSMGINVSSYTNVVTAFPSVGCGWSGLAQVNGPYSWLQGTGGMSTRVAAHELGHNYGAHHAQSMTCTDTSGSRVVYSSTCTVSEYGDPFDVMGSSTRLPWAWHRKQESIMLSSEILTVTSGTYTLGAASLVDSNPKSIRVLQPGTSSYWYVEYRIRFGTYDNYTAGAQPTNGVLIRQAPNSTRTQSQLLDANPSTTTFNDAAFVPGTVFVDSIHNLSIRVDSVGATSATITVNPPTSDTTPPTTPGNFTATEASQSSIQLTWTASTDNVGVTGYEIRRDGVLIASPGGGTTSYSDGGRTAGVTYGYSIVARDAAGNTSPAATTTGFITPPPPPDTTPPTMPGNFTATEASQSSIQLTWTASTDNVAVTSYQIWRNGSSIAVLPPSATSHLDTGRTPGVTYAYSIVAYDGAQNVSPTATTTGFITPPPPDTTPPTTPGSFTATASGTSSIQLTWTASTDDVSVTGYELRRDGALIATPSGGATSYLDVGRTPGVTYAYTLVARDAAGNTSGTASASGFITPPVVDTTPPTAPGSFRVSSQQGANVTLAWNASSDNVGVAGYRVYVDGSLAGSTTSLSLTVKPSKGSHTAYVVAFDAAGNVSASSNVVSFSR